MEMFFLLHIVNLKQLPSLPRSLLHLY